mgnify:CR=1 FL=1
MKNKIIETIRVLLDDTATMRAIKEDLPIRYAFMISQLLDKLENYLTTIHSIELNEKTTKKIKK